MINSIILPLRNFGFYRVALGSWPWETKTPGRLGLVAFIATEQGSFLQSHSGGNGVWVLFLTAGGEWHPTRPFYNCFANMLTHLSPSLLGPNSPSLMYTGTIVPSLREKNPFHKASFARYEKGKTWFILFLSSGESPVKFLKACFWGVGVLLGDKQVGVLLGDKQVSTVKPQLTRASWTHHYLWCESTLLMACAVVTPAGQRYGCTMKSWVI